MDEKEREASREKAKESAADKWIPIHQKREVKDNIESFLDGFDYGYAAAQSSGPGPRQALGGDVEARAKAFLETGYGEGKRFVADPKVMAAFAQSETARAALKAEGQSSDWIYVSDRTPVDSGIYEVSVQGFSRDTDRFEYTTDAGYDAVSEEFDNSHVYAWRPKHSTPAPFTPSEDTGEKEKISE